MGNAANFRTRAHIVKVARHMLPGPDNGVGGGCGGVHSPDLHSLDAAAAANTLLRLPTRCLAVAFIMPQQQQQKECNTMHAVCEVNNDRTSSGM